MSNQRAVIHNKITTSSNKLIHVFDNIFDYGQRQSIYYFCTRSAFVLQGHDSPELEVQNDTTLVSIFSETDSRNLGIANTINTISPIQEILEGYTSHTSMINLTTPSDKYHIHTDGVGLTLLYYVNVKWNIEWCGETIFFNDNTNDYEYVSPFVPGRLIIFDGTIPHMIRPSTPNATQHRMTYVTRFKK